MLVIQIAEILLKHHWYLATAESCTGGGLAQALTEIPGSSRWFERGFITYSNRAKQEMLSVNPDLLKKYGAVSEPVAMAMAQGAIQHSQAHCSMAITGIAGPEGGTDIKPIGTVWFAWAIPELIQCGCTHFKGDRHQIRKQAVRYAMQIFLQMLKEM